MAFQIVALTLDANDYVIERRVVPYPYPTRQEAVTGEENSLRLVEGRSSGGC